MPHLRRLIFFSLAVFLYVSSSAAVNPQPQWNPQADPSAVVTSGKVRFTILTPRMIRIQYSANSLFEDRATFAVVNRRLPVPSYTTRSEGGYLYIDTDSLHLRYKEGTTLSPTTINSTNLRITFQMNGKEVLWYPGKDDAMNLLGTSRTLDGNIGDTHRVKLEKGLLSRAGWSILDESPKSQRGDGSTTFAFDGSVDGVPWFSQCVDKDAIDWYFLGYGHQYKDALYDYTRIAGSQPMPPYYMFGYWYSKYQAYSSSQFQQLVRDMESNNVPHDVIMLDMDWHKSGWTGWTWNTSLIPNPTSLLSWMHTHKMKTALNLHPADGIGSDDQNFSKICADMGVDPKSTNNIPWQLEDSTFYRSFFNNLMRVRENEGVDFWWLDWQQDLTSKYVSGLGNTFWLNHVYYNDMAINRTDRRPVIFHRWGGMGSHRYPLGFSGDTFATYGTLQFESYFTATAANVCFGYWGHDGGGYLQPAECATDPELVLRWMQFCVFQPIFRTHGSSQSSCERRVWKFKNVDLQRQAFQLRYALVPYIYTHAREAYETGVSICRPLYYEWPEENKAYSVEDEYLFGKDILVAPIAVPSMSDGRSMRQVWLPEGQWYDMTNHKLVDGNKDMENSYALDEIPYFIRSGSIIPTQSVGQSLKDAPTDYTLWVIPGADGHGSLYEDNGDSQDYQVGEYAKTTFSQTHDEDGILLTIFPRQGSYKDASDTRRFNAKFFAIDKPKEVVLDGKVITTWQYDEVLKQLLVEMTEGPVSKSISLRIRNSSTGITPATISESQIKEQLYNIDGRNISVTPQRGIYISVKDKKSQKIQR